MDLSGIISIAGKPGLYTVVAQTKNGIIVQSVIDGKRIPAYSTHRISALEDISIYTFDDDIPLSQVFRNIWEKENKGKALEGKASGDELRNYMKEILPDFDEDRVYTSDIKKLLNWYNQLHDADQLKEKEEEAGDATTAAEPADSSADASSETKAKEEANAEVEAASESESTAES